MPGRDTNSPDEPLALSAAFTRELASALCRGGALGAGCEAYHGLWPYLRLMGIGKTMSGLSSDFLAALDAARAAWAVAPSTPRAVLISGCADYSALAHVVHAFRDAQTRPEVTALDLCETPLVLSRWYARRIGWSLKTACNDVLTHTAHKAYDMVLTSSFLGYFNPAQRRTLFKAYEAMLRPGGVLVLTNRIRTGPEDQLTGFSEEQVQAFAERAATLSASLPSTARLDARKVPALARAYARHLSSYPFNGEASLREAASAAGLLWDAGGVRTTQAKQPGLKGPTMTDGSDYLFVQLRKPQPGDVAP